MRRVVLVALPFLTSCGGYSEKSYRGDGTLRDHGWYSGSGRYTLDLGEVDLASRGERRYSLANLPPERLALGFGFRSGWPTNATVHLKLLHAGGTLIDEARPLREWVVSGSRDFRTFVYCGGEGNTWSEAPGTAWGCIFKPKAGEAYQLTLDIVDPTGPGMTAKLIVEGGPSDPLP